MQPLPLAPPGTPLPPTRRRTSLPASFRHAADGLLEAAVRGRNLRIQLVAGLGVAALGTAVPLGLAAQAALVLCVALVLAAEALNTALEALVDLHGRELRPEARLAKDAAAASVLVLATGSVLVLAVVAATEPSLALDAARLRRVALAGIPLLGAAAALLAPFRRPATADVLLAVGGVACLGALSWRTASVAFAALATALFAVAAATARRRRR